MKGLIKFGMIGVGCCLIGIAVAILFLVFSPNALSVFAAEKYLAKVCGAPVKIEAIRFLPKQGAFQFDKVSFPNPNDAQQKAALAFDKVLLRPDWKDLFSRPRQIAELKFTGGALELGLGGQEGNSLAAMRSALQANHSEETAAGNGITVHQCSVEDLKLRFQAGKLPLHAPTFTLAPFSVKEMTSQHSFSATKGVDIFLRSMLGEILNLNGLSTTVTDALKAQLGMNGA